MRKIKVLCSDADGVLSDLDVFQIWMIKDYYKKLGLPVPEIVNPRAYNIRDMYGITNFKRNIIWVQYFRRYCQEHPARPYTFQTLRTCQKMGITVPIITARAFVTTPIVKYPVRAWTEKWFELNGFEPDGIDWCPEKNSGPAKAEFCRKRKADMMVDDKIDNIDCTLDICDTVGFPTRWNEGYEPQNKEHDFYWAEDYWPDVMKLVMRRNG